MSKLLFSCILLFSSYYCYHSVIITVFLNIHSFHSLSSHSHNNNYYSFNYIHKRYIGWWWYLRDINALSLFLSVEEKRDARFPWVCFRPFVTKVGLPHEEEEEASQHSRALFFMLSSRGLFSPSLTVCVCNNNNNKWSACWNNKSVSVEVKC